MPQSPELAGGAGYTFEDFVAARYLAALLCESAAPGVDDAPVHEVALQQRDFGEPLDDLIVDLRRRDSQMIRLSLQCKRSLTVSKAASNGDFRDIIRDGLKTLEKENFREGIDRFGAAIGSVATGSFRTLTTLCELARASSTLAHFEARFSVSGNASSEMRAMRNDIEALLSEQLGAPCEASLLHRFLRHFVLIDFDYLHEGSIDNAAGADAVRAALPDSNSNASNLWVTLCRIAREGSGRSQQFSRSSLVTIVSKSYRLRGAPSLRPDIAKLEALTRSWILDIEDDVRGTKLARTTLVSQLNQRLKAERFVQVRGLPGSGKSVLVRRRIEMDLNRGPTLFLKSDRLEGRSWSAFATALGLANTNLVDLLTELAAVGSCVLYIDGIDRIEKQHQTIISDVVRAISREPQLANWRIVVSLRDSGAEPLRTWLPDLFAAGGVGTVDVRALDDNEALELANAQPDLRRLLFGAVAVREIVRRPFFAKILSQGLAIHDGDSNFAPRSEVDLVENWWARGGFNALGTTALRRQRAIVELGARRVRELSLPIAIAQLTPSAIECVDDLVADGILQTVRPGHSVRFAHDIFFEWALFHQFVDSGPAWLEVVKNAGEPPVIGRVVELLSQAEFMRAEEWSAELSKIDKSGMRSQWTRAWLLGPLSAPNFEENQSKFYDTTSADGFRLFGKALVWFQAEKTIPNPGILDGRIGDLSRPRDEVIRLADMMGWPSDFQAWQRLIVLVLDRLDTMPVTLIPDIVELFDVWQNAFAATANNLSTRLLNQSAIWLKDIERRRHSRDRRRSGSSSPWSKLEASLDELEQALRRLILRSARATPEPVTDYFAELTADENRLGEVYKELISYSPILVRTHPQALVDLSLLHFKDELPAARESRERQEAEQSAARRKEALAKPADERSREDEFAAMGLLSSLGGMSYTDWENLSVDRDRTNYFPASPLREPFHSLFSLAPSEALRLLKELTNHAMTAWRQLHRFDPQRRVTPIPIELKFPWGSQTFWGTRREYLWYRGLWAPQPLASAYLALENWAFDQLDAGRSADDLIRQIVEGNESIAILGTAISLMLRSTTISEVTLPLITSQRLWRTDLERRTQEGDIASASLIGFFEARGDRDHALAVDAVNKRPIRKNWLRELVPHFVWAGDQKMATAARAGIADFESTLPYEYEEQRGDHELSMTLLDDAKFNVEFAKLENYRAVRHPDDENTKLVVLDNPQASAPNTVEKLTKANENLQDNLHWSWANKALEGIALPENIAMKDAVAFAKRRDGRQLFKAIAGDTSQLSMRRGAVAGVAAAVLKYPQHCKKAELKWARAIVDRASCTPEQRDTLWTSGSIISWHPCISASRGLAAEIRAGDDGIETRKQLLRLVSHPLECVTLAAVQQAFTLRDIEPRLSWCALWLGLNLCQFEINHSEGGARTFDPSYIVRARMQSTNEAIAHFMKPGHWPNLPPMPPAWVPANANQQAISDDGDDDVDRATERRRWRAPNVVWDGRFAQQILRAARFRDVANSHETRALYMAFCQDLLAWVIQKIAPPWKRPGRREQSTHTSELSSEAGRQFAILAEEIDTHTISQLFLEPVFALENDECFSLLHPFVHSYICDSVLDAPVMPNNAIEIMSLCVERVLKDPIFNRKSYRAGELHGWHLPQLMQSLMFVSIKHAAGASRFVNGDWREIGLILPIIDRLVRTAGWSSSVMGDFLTLCERSRDVYPANQFADQILAALAGGRSGLKGWRGLLLPARIAGLVQHFASRETPMEPALGQKLLRVLDILVDMGDRRSAALQISDSFREIKAG